MEKLRTMLLKEEERMEKLLNETTESCTMRLQEI